MSPYSSLLPLTCVDEVTSFHNNSEVIVSNFVELVLIKHQVSLFRLSIIII